MIAILMRNSLQTVIKNENVQGVIMRYPKLLGEKTGEINGKIKSTAAINAA